MTLTIQVLRIYILKMYMYKTAIYVPKLGGDTDQSRYIYCVVAFPSLLTLMTWIYDWIFSCGLWGGPSKISRWFIYSFSVTLKDRWFFLYFNNHENVLKVDRRKACRAWWPKSIILKVYDININYIQWLCEIYCLWLKGGGYCTCKLIKMY